MEVFTSEMERNERRKRVLEAQQRYRERKKQQRLDARLARMRRQGRQISTWQEGPTRDDCHDGVHVQPGNPGESPPAENTVHRHVDASANRLREKSTVTKPRRKQYALGSRLGFTIEGYIDSMKPGLRDEGYVFSQRTLVSYRSALRRAEELVGKPIAEWASSAPQKMLEAIEREGLAESTRKHILSVVRGMFKWGVDTGVYNGKNPFGTTRDVKVARKLPDNLTTQQVEQLFIALREIEAEKYQGLSERARRFGWAQDGPSNKYEVFFRLVYYGGLGISEVTGLRKDAILDSAIIINGKGSKNRFVRLPDNMMTMLRDYVQEHPHTDFVFYGESGRASGIDLSQPMKGNTARVAFRKAIERVGLDPKNFGPRALRQARPTKGTKDDS